MRRLLTNFWILAAAVSLSACNGADARRSESLQLVEEFRIGGEELGEEFQFTTIRGLTPRDSVVYVTQSDDPVVRAYNSRGEFLQRIGRGGSGPGEISGSVFRAGIAGDTLWVIDDAIRISYFSLSGDFLDVVNVPAKAAERNDESGLFTAQPQVLTKGRGALGWGIFGAAELFAGQIPSFPLLRMTREGQTVDTIAWIPTRNYGLKFSRGPYRSQPFSDEPLYAFSPLGDRICVVDGVAAERSEGAHYSVTVIADAGDTLWSREMSYVPRQIDAGVIDSVRNYLRAASARWGVSSWEVDQALFVPKFWPPVADVFMGVDGSVWIRSDEKEEPVTYTVIDSAGEQIRTIEVARSVTLKWASADAAWGVELDEDDVPVIVRYRIRE